VLERTCTCSRNTP